MEKGQIFYLFQATIKENIRYGNPDASEEAVIEAAKSANAHEFIKKLPQGYDTQVRDGGKNLSGGEQQRIALARAFVKNAPIIVMDEATSALDNTNEKEIQLAMKKLMAGRTALVVAHRSLTIAACDEVRKMDSYSSSFSSCNNFKNADGSYTITEDFV